MSGYIREEGSKQGVESARLELQNSAGVIFATTYSGLEGAYFFDDWCGSDCYVIAQKDGYSPLRQMVPPSEGMTGIHLNLDLHPLSPESTSTPAETISVHQLGVPPKAHDAFEKGVKLMREKSDFHGAVAQFQSAIVKFPSYYEAYAAMGFAQYRLGDSAVAEASLRKSIELSGEKYADAMIDLAGMLNDLKRFAEAEPILRKGIALHDSAWRGHFEMARTLLGLKRPREAEIVAMKARDLKPDNAETYLLLINTHLQTHDNASLLRDADAFLKLVPTGPTSDQVRNIQGLAEKALEETRAQSPQ